MDNLFGLKIEETMIRNFDGKQYIRVFFEDSYYFVDVPSEIYEEWKDATGNYE